MEGLQVPDWLKGLLGANSAPNLPTREPSIGVDPHPRPIDQFQNIVDGLRPGDVKMAEMPFGPGNIGNIGNIGKMAGEAIEAAPALGKAAKDLAGPALKGLESAAARTGKAISETRWSELAKQFGGKGQ